MRAWWAALQFLTRIPTPRLTHYDAALGGCSAPFFPLVGLLIGFLLWAAAGLGADLPPGVLAALLLVFWVGITGGLHLDGLGDSADAWLGGHGDRARSLRIMQDPRSGAAAVIAIGLLLILKFAALQALLTSTQDGALPLALLLAPSLGRGAALALFLTTPSARDDGFGAALTRHLPRRAAWAAVIASALAAPLLAGVAGVWAVALVCALSVALRALSLQRLGGSTGDVAGALTEMAEAAVLLALLGTD